MGTCEKDGGFEETSGPPNVETSCEEEIEKCRLIWQNLHETNVICWPEWTIMGRKMVGQLPSDNWYGQQAHTLKLKCWWMQQLPLPWSRFTPWTMKSDHGRYNFFHEKPNLQRFSASLGVSWMRTKRNDHAPKSECVDFLFIYIRKGQCFY